jgi:hypothetical protein
MLNNLLLKNTDIDIPPQEPTLEDCLNRRQNIENLTSLVKTISQPFVMSVEAPWGCGKTTFIRMWQSFLEQEGHTCLYFNAWKNDYVEDPLTAFIGQLDGLIKKDSARFSKNPKLMKLWKGVKVAAGKIIRFSVPTLVGIASHGLINLNFHGFESEKIADDLSKLLSEKAEKSIEEYEKQSEGLSSFQKQLSEFILEFSKSEKYINPLIIFVDEIDRCKPPFAIALLERIKHLFNIEGIMFVLAVDYQQIISSIRALYGNDIDADGYLRRFVDFRFQLINSDSAPFALKLYSKFGLDNLYPRGEKKQLLLETFTLLSDVFNLSLRVQEQCFTQINLVLRTTNLQNNFETHLLSFLVILKSVNYESYLSFQNRTDEPDIVFKNISQKKAWKDLLQGTMGNDKDFHIICWICAQLIHYCSNDEQLLSLKKSLSSSSLNVELENERKFNTKVSSFLDPQGKIMNSNYQFLTHIFQLLDLSEKLSIKS